MYQPKFIENQKIPIPLMMKEFPEFYIYKYERNNKNIILHYLIEGRGVSVYFKEKDKFDLFPQFFNVKSGGWYGDIGRWTPIERYSGTIICKNVSTLNRISEKGKNFRFIVSKAFFKKKLIIESDKVGIVELKCKKIVPQDYTIFIFSITENRWITRKYAIENLENYYNGTLEEDPFI